MRNMSTFISPSVLLPASLGSTFREHDTEIKFIIDVLPVLSPRRSMSQSPRLSLFF